MSEDLVRAIDEKVKNRLTELGVKEDALPETVLPSGEAKIQEKEKVADPSYTEVEKEAMLVGWKPEGVKSAEEFLRAAPLYDRIKRDSKELRELKSAVDELKRLQNEQRRAGYEQALAELKDQKRDAIHLSDIPNVERIDSEIEKIKVQKDLVKDVAPQLIPEVQEFTERHKDWMYAQTAEADALRAFVARRDNELMGEGLSPKEHLRRIEEELAVTFPHKFKKEVLDPEHQVASVSSDAAQAGTKSSKRKLGFSDLNDTQKDIARQFAKRGIMDIDAYVKSLQEIGEL